MIEYLGKAMEFWEKGFTVSPKTYDTARQGHELVGKLHSIVGEALDEMSPSDETPYQATGGELSGILIRKFNSKLGN